MRKTGNINLVGLTGHAQAGKNYVGSIISKNYGYLVWAFAFPLKQRTYSTTDKWPLENVIGNAGKSEELRTFLQQEGTENSRRKIREDIWIRATEALVYYAETEWSSVINGLVICDVRFPDEAQYIRDAGGKVLRIRNDNLDLSHPMYQHASEIHIPNIEVDGIINNTDRPSEANLLNQINQLLSPKMGDNK